MIQANISDIGKNGHHRPASRCEALRGTPECGRGLAKTYNRNLTMRTSQIQPYGRMFYKIASLYFSKESRPGKTKAKKFWEIQSSQFSCSVVSDSL